MSKLISYSLFDSPCEHFEKMAYIRGFYFNARMNNLIYPDWRTHLEIQRIVYEEFKELFDWLVENNNLSLSINEGYPALCEGMLWRMKPIWTQDVSHVLCRDADAITTYKEAQYIQHWLQNIKSICAIHDNPAHGGLMGGMIGFDTASFKAISEINSFDELLLNYDLSQRGSDQNLLNNVVYKLGEVSWYDDSKDERSSMCKLIKLPMVDEKLWESNLCSFFIGSAGINELETLRFFKRFDIYNWKYQDIEKQFSKLFYWHG